MLSFHIHPPFQLSASSFQLLSGIASRGMTGWLDLPHDPDHLVAQIKNFVKKRKGSFDKILCLGMGGSALGITTLQKALYPFDDRLTVVDNLDSTTISHILKNLNPKRTLVLVISKSGETLETLTQYHIFKDRYAKTNYVQNFIVLTGPTNGTLREIANHDGLSSFPIPTDVGGRFSVLSTVGLLPLALLGGSLEQLLKGARAMKARCLENSAENPALQLAHSLQTTNYKLQTIPLFIYSDHLFPMGLWYQQLLAESIGKTREIGLTPLPLRGASDQHSVLQLLQDGPNDKLTMFIDIVKPKVNVKIPTHYKLQTTNSLHSLLRLECRATEQALREDGRPTVMIEIPELNEFALGELFMLFEMQVAILGELYGINAFDQPGVEKSKKIMKTLLKYISGVH